MDKQHKKQVKRELATIPRTPHVLPQYANPQNLSSPLRTASEEIYRLIYNNRQQQITLEETISVDGETHILELASYKYTLEATTDKPYETKEIGLHHHPKKGHPGHHLQFKIVTKDSKIVRIHLENLDRDDYVKCIKGFLRVAKDVIQAEQEKEQLPNLTNYFFTEAIETLQPERNFLVGKVQEAAINQGILDENNKPFSTKQIKQLENDQHLLPFFNKEEDR